MSAPPGDNGIDTNSVISQSSGAAYRQMGDVFAVRYISRGSSEDSGDLTHGEAAGILAGGLALMPVQHVRLSPWQPTGDLGTSDGKAAGALSASVGFPTGVNVWCDLEGVDTSSSAADVTAYADNWAAAVTAAGYVPGLYVGANSGLTADQLGSLNFQHYWKSFSTVPTVTGRGYQLIQSANSQSVDNDKTQNDDKGGSVIWLHP